MATSNIKASIPCDIHSVWKVVTEVENYTWRSDLSKTEVISDKRFIEYTKEGYPTTFTITITEPYKRWEFDMENSNMKGHWVGLFISKDNETEIDFTEYVTAKKFFMKPFVKSYLKKQQAQFVTDLKKAIGAGWQDKKYNELGVVVRDCNKALNDILVIMLQAEKYVALLAKSLSEYESVQLGSTNGISASTPQTSSFAVTPSSADTTTFESNTFGSNLAFVQDRLSAERYFSRGNHYEEYRDYWENGNYTFSRNENPELVYVRARDIEGVYLSDRELGNPEGFWTRNGREGWSRENILRRASHIQDVRQNTESGMSLDELSQNPVLDDTIRSYYNNPVQVAQVGSYYVFQSDGRHRTLAAQSLDTYIPVLVTGSYTRND